MDVKQINQRVDDIITLLNKAADAAHGKSPNVVGLYTTMAAIDVEFLREQLIQEAEGNGQREKDPDDKRIYVK